MKESELSYAHGASSDRLIGATVGAVLERTANTLSDRTALVVRHQEIRWTWNQLREKVQELAMGLLQLGIEPGDRVGIWSPNNAEWILAQLATAEAGVVLVNINPSYRLHELEYSLKQVGCKALITAESTKYMRYIDMLRELLPEIDYCDPGDLRSDRLPDLRILINIGPSDIPGFIPFSRVAAGGTGLERRFLDDIRSELQFDDPVNIQFTSGTTGLPKAATLTHHNIVNNALLTGRRMRLSSDDILCIPVPMYHCFGMVLGVLNCIVHGATMVLPSEGFDAHETLAAVEAERCTALHGVPTMFIAEIDDPDFSRFDLSSLRTGIMAGAPCPIALMKDVIELMHMKEITIAYGMTETSPVSCQTTVEDPLERRVDSVGRVLPHTEVKIVDENDRIVPLGERGELLTRGYCVMQGYWGDREHTARVIDRAGWMHSGDLATMDADGYCRIVGRIKDMVIRGGENIYPREIEEFLYTHPKIDEVEVFGVPDEKYGEEICAWISLMPGEEATEEEIRAFCKGRIAHFKVPRYIRFVDHFPMTVTGKVQKFRMREAMARELEEENELELA